MAGTAKLASASSAIQDRQELERIIPTQYRPTIPFYSTTHAELNENFICASAEQT